jgi:type III secretory pathway component EscR
MNETEVDNKMTLHESFVNEICHKMEDFILNEIDYSKENGYSGRARRFMKRKLNKELEEFFNKRYKTDPDYEDESILIQKDECTNCMSIMYLSTVLSAYAFIGFIMYKYQSCPLQQL